MFVKFSILENTKIPKVAPNAFVLTQHRFYLNSGKMCFCSEFGAKLKHRGLLPGRDVLIHDDDHSSRIFLSASLEAGSP